MALESSSGDRRHLGTWARLNRGRLQLEAVVAGGDQVERDGAVGGAVEILGFKPCTKPWIVDFGLALPKVGLKTALDAEMPELQFDVRSAFREITTDIVR